MKFGGDLSLRRIQSCGFSLTRLVHRRLQAKRKRLCFCSTYNVPTPLAYNGFPRSWWQNHKCVGGGLSCRETFRNFLKWAEPEAKRRFFRYPAHTVQERFYCKPMALMESGHSEDVPFGVITHQISGIPNWKPKPKKNFGFHKFISFILSHLEKNRCFQRYDFFQIREK